MTINKFKVGRPVGVTLLLIATSVALTGCFEDRYLHGRDTITLGAGDAVQTNKETHTIHPWPKHAKKAEIEGNGKRTLIGVKRYEQNKSIKPKGLNTTSVSVQEGPGAQADVGIQK